MNTCRRNTATNSRCLSRFFRAAANTAALFLSNPLNQRKKAKEPALKAGSFADTNRKGKLYVKTEDVIFGSLLACRSGIPSNQQAGAFRRGGFRRLRQWVRKHCVCLFLFSDYIFIITGNYDEISAFPRKNNDEFKKNL